MSSDGHLQGLGVGSSVGARSSGSGVAHPSGASPVARHVAIPGAVEHGATDPDGRLVRAELVDIRPDRARICSSRVPPSARWNRTFAAKLVV